MEIKTLRDHLKQKDESINIDSKEKTTTEMSKMRVSQPKNKNDYSNPLDIITMRLKTWKARNKEKKRIITRYLENVEIIRGAFEEI